MRQYWGSLLAMLAVLMLALTAPDARGQMTETAPVGNGVQATSGGAPQVADAPSLPVPAAPSALGYYPTTDAMGMAGPAMGPALPYGPPPAAYGPAPYGPPAGPMYPGMYGPPGALLPATYQEGAEGQAIPQPLPDGAASPMDPASMIQPAGYFDMHGGVCPSCGGSGCDYCAQPGLVSGFLASCASTILPFSEGGRCAPRWYDVVAEFTYLTREDATRRLDFTSLGVSGDIVLSTDNLSFQEHSGFRLTGAVEFWAGGNLEFTYHGLNNWNTSATVVSNNDELFSVISDYGNDPFLGFDETDRARQHSLAYSSGFDSFELHFRKRWTGANCRLQGSWLAGVRYIYLKEDFEYLTIGGDDDALTPGLQSRGVMDYDTRTHNSLTGFQIGGDLWTTFIPGISLGGDLKAGVYGNYAKQNTSILASTTAPVFTANAQESDTGTGAAFVGEANILAIYRLSPNWTLRGGYSLLYINGAALAPENFNSTPPFSGFNRRISEVNNNGAVLYHGLVAGIEWMW